MIPLIRKRFLALLFLALVACAARVAHAGEGARTEPRDTSVAGGFLSRTAARFSWFGWARHGGSARADEPAGAAVDPDTESKNLEPYYGCSIDSIIVAGNKHTKTIVILREMASKQGAVLDERLIRRDSAYLRGLGYFAEVRMTAEQGEAGRCRLRVEVVDRPAIFMRVPYPVVNYDFQLGLSYGATWKIKNFRGLGEDLAVSGITRKDREEGAGFSWSNPWFLGRRAPFRFDSYAYRRLNLSEDTDEEYLKEQVGASVGFGLPLTQNLVKQLWLKTNLSFERRKSNLMLADASGNYSGRFYFQNFISPGAELEYDSRDNRISPFNGMLHRIRLRRFSTVQGPEQRYIFYGFSDYFYVPTGEYRSFIFGVDGDIREGDTPTYLQMKLGGVRDVRGFADDRLRGTAKLVATLQYRARLVGTRVFRLPKIGKFDFTMNWVAFIDTGALTDDIRDVSRKSFYSTGGLGVELISPFRDLIRLEMATDGRNSPAFYMTAGTDF
ncbi:MAG: BamA/TamA family outer membrane protein [Candidatus Krumholzibacteriia bacterium]